ncbi:MAG TPA: penicillin-binding protein 2 [Actinomycetes bacterium]|jgi:peptidoglycan glycosyltransferase|nr:penicillin-binding protein 2 [Actinomycetes bacterium]
MNAQVRRVAAVVLVGFLILFAAPLYWQVLAADRLKDDPRNSRVLIKEYSIERGQIVLPDGTPVARSVATKDQLKYERRYQQGPRYGMITGFDSLVFGRTLAESRFNSFLLGKAPEQFAQNLSDLLTSRPNPGGTLVLTLDPAAQRAAEGTLADRKGAVVALDPTTGAVLAMTTFPRYDPNDLSSHDTEKVRKAWAKLNKDRDKPLLNRAAGELYPPGSTFKIITAAAALSAGMSPDTTRPNEHTYKPPQTTREIQNFGGENCLGGKDPLSMAEALEVSCNTWFAHLGVDLGTKRLVATAERFGLNNSPEFQLPGAAESQVPTELDPPSLAQSAIGQRDVRVSPLQMASVIATVANGGRRMAPYVVDRVLSPDGKTVKRFDPDPLGQVVSPEVADQLKQMLGLVVNGPNGTGSAAQIPGLDVFGKTGTAQHGTVEPPHAWFVGSTSKAGKSIAVAAIVEDGGNLGSEATGGREAAPIVRAVMDAYLNGGSQ